jgi:adenylate cyclase
LSRSTIEKLRLLGLLVAGAAAIGCVYSLILGTGAIGPAMTALIGGSIGALISLGVIGFELFGASRLLDRDGRRLPLAAALAVRTVLYGLAIMAALLVVPWVCLGRAPIPFRPGLLGDIAFSLAATLIFVSLAAVAQLIGLGTLGNLLLARYYQPRAEQRIVVFLDMVGSTDLAERLGDVPFYAMLSDAFTRLSRVVTDFGGEVHRYVGDAMIATWPLGTPQQNARPIRCLFACREMLAGAAPEFGRRHGHLPAFRAGMHAGPLVAGEIGGFKREIALIGDTMNTAARVEQACRGTGHAMLASGALIERVAMPDGIAATSLGAQRLRGKAADLELFALERAGGVQSARTAVS